MGGREEVKEGEERVLLPFKDQLKSNPNYLSSSHSVCCLCCCRHPSTTFAHQVMKSLQSLAEES